MQKRLPLFLATTCLTTACLIAPAWAQDATAAPTTETSQAGAEPQETLGEIVVTATRQASTVNRVPLSISAETQRSLDQQGIKNVSDLQRTVPALNVSGQVGGVATFTIRGIRSTQGAATTGVYLDDTPLQRRNVSGLVATNNGTPAPPLFDLERVEVLRGPQGTLFGGSSQGGTIRFITPAPSLTRYSGYGRAEIAAVKDGDPSYEAGLAVGGPIVQDKLGFRLSAFYRRNGGFIDMVDPYNNGRVRFKNANSADISAFRGALRWAATDRAEVTVAYLHTEQVNEGGPDTYNLPVAGTFTTPESCYDTRRSFPTATQAVACPAPGAAAPGIYRRPAQTYGPFPFAGEYNNFINWIKQPATTVLNVANLTLDYDFDAMTFKSVTSYIHDFTKGVSQEAPQLTTQQRTTAFPGATGFPLYAPMPDYFGRFTTYNQRYGLTQEIRFASSNAAGPLTWVAGAFYANLRTHSNYCAYQPLGPLTQSLFGITVQQRYGLGELPSFCSSVRDQRLKDVEIAGFGEVNYNITEQLRAIAGVRVSRVSFDYNQVIYGTVNNFLDPLANNGQGLTSGSVTESPVAPRFGLQYQLSPNDMIYATVAKGFRPGGVNGPVSPVLCEVGLRDWGVRSSDLPLTYDADTVWSYEAGVKLRVLGDRVQLNSSAYRIDWTGVQLSVTVPGCGQGFVSNAGQARSQGFDLQAQARLFGGLSAIFNVGYTDAKYTETALGPAPTTGTATTRAVLVTKGDTFPLPDWQLNVGLEYEFTLGGRFDSYLRADYSWASGYNRTSGPGSSGYAPDIRQADAADLLNLRAGVRVSGVDVNVFVNNALNSKDQLNLTGGRSACVAGTGAECGNFRTYTPFLLTSTGRPREIGVQAAYRF